MESERHIDPLSLSTSSKFKHSYSLGRLCIGPTLLSSRQALCTSRYCCVDVRVSKSMSNVSSTSKQAGHAASIQFCTFGKNLLPTVSVMLLTWGMNTVALTRAMLVRFQDIFTRCIQSQEYQFICKWRLFDHTEDWYHPVNQASLHHHWSSITKTMLLTIACAQQHVEWSSPMKASCEYFRLSPSHS
jgi:hypothetical protein